MKLDNPYTNVTVFLSDRECEIRTEQKKYKDIFKLHLLYKFVRLTNYNRNVEIQKNYKFRWKFRKV